MKTIPTLLLLSCSTLFAQPSRMHLSLAPAIDTSDPAIASVLHLWSDYLNSRPDSIYDNPCWVKEEKQRYRKFDFLNSVYFTPGLYALLPRYRPTVMSVAPADSGFIIRTLFAAQVDSGYTRPFCITRIMARKEGAAFRLCNILPYNTRSWRREQVGRILFIFPQDHHFHQPLAQRMSGFLDSLSALWEAEPFPVEFYMADDLSEIMSLRGLDYYIGEGYNRGRGGLTDPANHMVFGAGQDEWYPHEFVHVVINLLFPGADPLLLEGYATMLGGSRGHDLSWHVEKLRQYLGNHPDQRLEDLLMSPRFGAELRYAVGGLICRVAMEKGGLPALRRLFSVSAEDGSHSRALETVLGVREQEFDRFMKTVLAGQDSR